MKKILCFLFAFVVFLCKPTYRDVMIDYKLPNFSDLINKDDTGFLWNLDEFDLYVCNCLAISAYTNRGGVNWDKVMPQPFFAFYDEPQFVKHVDKTSNIENLLDIEVKKPSDTHGLLTWEVSYIHDLVQKIAKGSVILPDGINYWCKYDLDYYRNHLEDYDNIVSVDDPLRDLFFPQSNGIFTNGGPIGYLYCVFQPVYKKTYEKIRLNVHKNSTLQSSQIVYTELNYLEHYDFWDGGFKTNDGWICGNAIHGFNDMYVGTNETRTIFNFSPKEKKIIVANIVVYW